MLESPFEDSSVSCKHVGSEVLRGKADSLLEGVLMWLSGDSGLGFGSGSVGVVFWLTGFRGQRCLQPHELKITELIRLRFFFLRGEGGGVGGYCSEVNIQVQEAPNPKTQAPEPMSFWPTGFWGLGFP